MNNEYDERFDGYFELRDKMFERFNEVDVLSDSEYISGYDLANAINSQIKFYSDILIVENEKFTRKRNRLTQVRNISYGVNDGECYAEVFEKLSRRKLNGTKDFNTYGYNKLKNEKFFETINLFADEFKGFNFSFNPLKHDLDGVYVYTDDLFSVIFDICDSNSGKVCFDKFSDISAGSMYPNRKLGNLSEYIYFYSDDLLKKISIKIDDLNPLFQEIIRKQRELSNANKNSKIRCLTK